MPQMISLCAIVALFTTVATAHMQLHFPPPFNASNNPHRTTSPDPYLQYPYDCCGPNDRWVYPCRGYHTLLNTTQGRPTATWTAGSKQHWTIAGIGNHYGGSCQVGFSTDNGLTFRVATSYEGNCPHRNGGDGPEGQQFDFTVPKDLAPGPQLFAWIWYNREQELNMNCAAVNITASGEEDKILSSTAPSPYAPEPAFGDRPLMFVADDGNRCLTPKTTAELKYPLPGTEIVPGDGVYPLELPSGECSGVGRQAYDGGA